MPNVVHKFRDRDIKQSSKASRRALAARRSGSRSTPAPGGLPSSSPTTAPYPAIPGTRSCPMLRTRSGLPKHCTYEVDRYGKRRSRFRRRGVSVYLTGIPWSEDFMRQYAAALEREQGQRGADRRQPAQPAGFVLGAVRVLLRLARISRAEGQHASRSAATSSNASAPSMVTVRSRTCSAFTSRPSSPPRRTRRRRPTICSRCCAWCSITPSRSA